MKKISICLILLIKLYCNEAFCQTGELCSAEIKWEHFGTETVVDVKCDQFDAQFIKTKQSHVIKNFKTLAELNKLRSLKWFNKKTDYKTIDVRGKIIFHYSKSTIEYCFDQFGHFYKDGSLTNNRHLWSFITKFIPKKDQ